MDLKALLFSFQGRIGRKQFFLGVLGLALAGLAPALLIAIALALHAKAVAGLVAIIWAVAMFWASIALQVKRLQDRDRNWYFLFVSFIPFVGPIWLAVEVYFLSGTIGDNRFGKDPVV